MWSSAQISAHATDVAATAACIAAGTGQCVGISYLPSNSASTRWSARANGGSLFTLSGVDSWELSSRRRLSEVDPTPLPQLRKSWLARMLNAMPPDMDERPPIRMIPERRLAADDRV